MMYKLGFLLVFCVVNALEEGEKECDDITGHHNYQLLPQRPNCGLNNILSNYYISEEVEWPNASAKVGEFPWLAYLEVQRKHKRVHSTERYNWVDSMNCTGSLINNRYILTAAHCINKTNDYYIRVSARLGKWWLPWDELDCEQDACRKDRVIYNVEKIIRHRQLSWDGNNDLCLLRLNTQLQFNEYIRPVCLPISCFWQRKDLECYEMTMADARRLKRISDNKYIKSTLMGKYMFHKQKQAWCVRQYYKRRIILDSQMCVGGETWDNVCKGDPGAPLHLDISLRGHIIYYLVGVQGYKRDCYPGPGNLIIPPAVYTRVSYFTRWILDNIRP